MIFKLLFLISLIALATSIILKKLLAKSVHAKGIQTQITTKKLLEKISPYDVSFQEQKAFVMKNQVIHLPADYASSKQVTDHASAMMAVGLAILSKGKNTWQKRLKSMATFDQIFLPFALIISIFGILAKTIPVNISFSILASALLLNCLNNFYLTWIRKLAMNLALDRLKSITLYTKKEVSDVAKTYLQSFPYQHLIPNSLKWLG